MESQTQQPQQPQQEQTPAPVQQVQVFIVEDDPMVSTICKNYIEKVNPYAVIGISGDESDALAKIRALKPQLVLLDLHLNKGNGMNLLKSMRKESHNVDVFLMTASKDSATVCEAFRYGAVDYLIKPFDFDRLRQGLRNYLKFVNLTVENKDIEQEEIDQYKYTTETTTSGSLSSLPKGVHYMTLNQLNEYLEAQENALSCQQISQALSLSKITTWRYLEYLVERGKVEVSLEYGMIGRPTKLYRAVR
ncbi:MAG: response regulator [Peptococcaceae bacterium]|nr:response regulator [Peptococcaceae bacterium]